jgi:carboxypeptidase family protein/TonB-dependent receptor-like protein
MRRSFLPHFFPTLFIMIVALGMATPANAQFRAGIQGSVMDAHGAVIVGATITLINKETNRTQQSASGDEGFYRFDRLPPGQYMLVVEHAGFKKAVLRNVEVSAEEAQGINVKLEVGEITDTVTISAELANQLQTENANIASTITRQEVLRLPQYGRDPYELVRLAPGVFGLGARICCGLSLGLPNASYPSGSSQSIFADENQPPVSANGQRVTANNFEVDGVSVNSQEFGGSATLTPSQEAVKEVRVASSSYSAENGGAGVLVQVVSQNGTNQLHGSAFYKYNDPSLNAYQKWGGPFSAPHRDPKRYRQWGGSLGGRLYLPSFGEGGPALWSGKNKLFFFFAYETIRRRNVNYGDFWTETPEYRQVLREQRAGSIAARVVSAPGVEPRILGLIPRDCSSVGVNDPLMCATLPGGLDIGSPAGILGQSVDDPFIGGLGGGLDGIPDVQFAQAIFPLSSKSQQLNGRFDFQATDHDLVTFSFYHTPIDQKNTGSESRPRLDSNLERRNLVGALLWNHLLSPTTLNEARFNVTRLSEDGVKSNPDILWGIPEINIGQFSPFCCVSLNFGPSSPRIRYRTSYNFRDVMSKVIDTHGLRFGAELAYEQNNDAVVGAPRPAYSFRSLWNFANDAPLAEFGLFDPKTGIPTDLKKYLRARTSAFFLQDDWKVRPNLTLNLGLRWEYFSPLREKFGNLSNVVFGSGENGLKEARLKIGGPLQMPDNNNFGPQVGFAWSPQTFIGLRTKDKLALRGGFGINYSGIPQEKLNVRFNDPFFIFSQHFADLTGDQILYTLGTTLTSYSGWPSNPNTIQAFDPVTNIPLEGGFVHATAQDLSTPYTYRYSLDADYRLAGDWVASLGYQGSASHKLTRLEFVPASPRLFVTLTTTDGNSSFNALLAQLTHRFSKGFNLSAQYRWSKSIDTDSGGFSRLTERGPSDFDVTHYFVASGLWDLPVLRNRRNLISHVLGGCQLNGILTASSGLPWTPTYSDLTRPVAYLGGLKQNTSNEAFMQPRGTFGTDASPFFVRAPEGAVVAPVPGIGRNVFRGPHYFTVDMSVVKRLSLPKSMRIGDAAGIDLRANFFNVFNMLNLAPFQFSSLSTIIDGPGFGRAEQALGGRVVELQARFSF